mmetsp:Transcript_65674/g.182756  ORF Transcript_65674/g.182756 Transcript_65674/m.182756 type:complete len:794 (+) Transcript_65674:58-2439(+)
MADAVKGSRQAFKKGDAVYVFYRMSKRCRPDRKYLAVLDPRHGALRPRTGMSDGWVPARVAVDQNISVHSNKVRVEYSWNHFYTQRGQLTDVSTRIDGEWEETFDIVDVRHVSDFYRAAGVSHEHVQGQSLPLVPPHTMPDLAILTFRWGGLNEIVPPEQWGDTGSSVSDLFVDSFIDRAVVPRLGFSFEVWTLYIESASDLAKVADAAHLIFGPHHPLRRAKRVCAMYFLYPTGFEENCVPTRETGEDSGAALVDQKSLFRAMQAVERAGIPTQFPHASGFYELLSSKRWTSMMTLTPHLRVPPTVALPRMLVEHSVTEAAEMALSSLAAVRQQQAMLRGEKPSEEPKESCRGVAKLGFSWEALDVKYWEGQESLEEALSQLTQSIEINQELTGQPHDLETIMIQDYVSHDLEMRLYVVNGKVESTIYTKFCKIKANREFGDFQESLSQDEAAGLWMGGDRKALEDGDRQAREITNHWLVWVRTQVCDVPPAIRFDYFIGRRPGQKGKAFVWTLEICELGFSMLGDEELPNKVFGAMLQRCLGVRSASDFKSQATSSAPVEAPVVIAETVVPLEAQKEPTEEPVAEEEGSAAAGGSNKSDTPQEAAAEANEQALATAEGGAAAGAASKSDSAERMAADADVQAPSTCAILYIYVPASPFGCADQQACTGEYTLVEGQMPNGKPLWRHINGKRWLFRGADGSRGNWYVGDEEERDQNFKCYQGYICHQDQDDALPHQLTGAWNRGPVDGISSAWKQDPTIIVSDTPAPRGFDGLSPGGKANKGKGKKSGGKHR